MAAVGTVTAAATQVTDHLVGMAEEVAGTGRAREGTGPALPEPGAAATVEVMEMLIRDMPITPGGRQGLIRTIQQQRDRLEAGREPGSAWGEVHPQMEQ